SRRGQSLPEVDSGAQGKRPGVLPSLPQHGRPAGVCAHTSHSPVNERRWNSKKKVSLISTNTLCSKHGRSNPSEPTPERLHPAEEG
ncbi:hypothetical protein DNTS_024194, partial [Danionella cerebrum]